MYVEFINFFGLGWKYCIDEITLKICEILRHTFLLKFML